MNERLSIHDLADEVWDEQKNKVVAKPNEMFEGRGIIIQSHFKLGQSGLLWSAKRDDSLVVTIITYEKDSARSDTKKVEMPSPVVNI